MLPLLVFHACLSSAALAQFKEGGEGGSLLGESVTQNWQAGVIVTADSGPCQGIVASIPVPIDWPEQEVTVVDEDVSPTARVGEQMVEGTVKMMVVTIRQLPAGKESKALVTFAVRRSAQIPPEDTSIYQLPNTRKLPRDIQVYLGPSPLIESRHPKIRTLAKEIGADAETAWQHVEAIYDWVREKVEYKNGPLKGAIAALNDGTGDCEELTSLFIAICRAADIPARTVWVPEHCYPEFYLVDGEGKGHWFPCQAAGSRAFGGMPDHRPILQKGDNFRPPHNPRERQRYMAEHLTGQGGKPKVEFVRKQVTP
jgi:transglutaminase-like putative cysteine protease